MQHHLGWLSISNPELESVRHPGIFSILKICFFLLTMFLRYRYALMCTRLPKHPICQEFRSHCLRGSPVTSKGSSIDFIWLSADRPALLFLASASGQSANCLQRRLLSFSTILLQSLGCLKSILPLSDDDLKMNAEEKIPVFYTGCVEIKDDSGCKVCLSITCM